MPWTRCRSCMAGVVVSVLVAMVAACGTTSTQAPEPAAQPAPAITGPCRPADYPADGPAAQGPDPVPTCPPVVATTPTPSPIRFNPDGERCFGIAEIGPTPEGAGPEALAGQPSMCVEDLLSPLPDIIEVASPVAGATIWCEDPSGSTPDWVDPDDAARRQMEIDRPLTWFDGAGAVVSVAASPTSPGPYAVGFAWVLPESLPTPVGVQAWGAAHLAFGADRPLRFAVTEEGQVQSVAVDLGFPLGLQPMLRCDHPYWQYLTDVLAFNERTPTQADLNQLIRTIQRDPAANFAGRAQILAWLDAYGEAR